MGDFTPATISQRDWNEYKGEIARLHQLIKIQQQEIDELKARLAPKTPQTGPKYRVIEFAPEGGRRYAKSIRTPLLITQKKEEVKKFISDYWAPDKPKKPYTELKVYLGQKRVYEYEL